jgi:hypothetical protein
MHVLECPHPHGPHGRSEQQVRHPERVAAELLLPLLLPVASDESDTPALQAERARFRTQILLTKLAALPNGVALAPVLNVVLSLTLPETDATRDLSPVDRTSAAMTLIVSVLLAHAAATPFIVIVDNAISMDAVSWAVCAQVAHACPRMMLVLVTRPVNKTYVGLFDNLPSEAYAAIAHVPSTHRILLHGVRDHDICRIAMECLRATQLSDALGPLLVRKASGNPLVVREYCHALLEANLLSVLYVGPRFESVISRDPVFRFQ